MVSQATRRDIDFRSWRRMNGTCLPTERSISFGDVFFLLVTCVSFSREHFSRERFFLTIVADNNEDLIPDDLFDFARDL